MKKSFCNGASPSPIANEQNWVSAVRQDSQIEIAQKLTYKVLRNSFPKILQAMASILLNDGEGDLQKLVESSLVKPAEATLLQELSLQNE